MYQFTYLKYSGIINERSEFKMDFLWVSQGKKKTKVVCDGDDDDDGHDDGDHDVGDDDQTCLPCFVLLLLAI